MRSIPELGLGKDPSPSPGEASAVLGVPRPPRRRTAPPALFTLTWAMSAGANPGGNGTEVGTLKFSDGCTLPRSCTPSFASRSGPAVGSVTTIIPRVTAEPSDFRTTSCEYNPRAVPLPPELPEGRRDTGFVSPAGSRGWEGATATGLRSGSGPAGVPGSDKPARPAPTRPAAMQLAPRPAKMPGPRSDWSRPRPAGPARQTA